MLPMTMTATKMGANAFGGCGLAEADVGTELNEGTGAVGAGVKRDVGRDQSRDVVDWLGMEESSPVSLLSGMADVRHIHRRKERCAKRRWANDNSNG